MISGVIEALKLAWQYKRVIGIALAVLAVIGGFCSLYGWVYDRGYAQAQSELKADVATSKAALATMTTNRDTLLSQIQQANAATEAARAAALASQAQAQAAYAASAKTSATKRAAIASAPGTGPDEMNTFLLNTFQAGEGAL